MAAHVGALHATAKRLDSLRARLLQWTLRAPLLRRIFLDRPLRLFVMFLAFEAIALVVACTVPVWQLVLGPLIYGTIHLASSVRYIDYGLRQGGQATHPRALRWFVGVCAAYIGYRVLRFVAVNAGGAASASEWQGTATVDALLLVAGLTIAAWAYRVPASSVARGVLMVLPVIWGLLESPRMTVGILAFAHNFVAFAVWYQIAAHRRDRLVVACSAVVLGLLTLLLATGSLESVRTTIAIDAASGTFGLSLERLGRFFWRTAPEDRWPAIAAAFALGQSTHYFVWLRAIPDQAHKHAVPASFQQSVRLLHQDFGPRFGRWVIGVVLVGTIAFFALGFDQGRQLYFAVAGFHGFVEIATFAMFAPRQGAQVDTPTKANRSPAHGLRA